MFILKGVTEMFILILVVLLFLTNGDFIHETQSNVLYCLNFSSHELESVCTVQCLHLNKTLIWLWGENIEEMGCLVQL